MSEQLEPEMEVIKTDFYLKLASEADMKTVLHDFYKQEEITVVDEETGEESTQVEGDPYFVPNTADYAVDVVGTIQEPTGNTLTGDEGMEYPEMEAVDGYHANLREELTAEQEAALPTVTAPATPQRKWAGDN